MSEAAEAGREWRVWEGWAVPDGMVVSREAMEFDVVVVGAGPAGLAAAIRLKQLSPEASVCVVEKGGEVGAHILSGCVLETRALDELLPDWRERGAPLRTQAGEDRFLLLTRRRSIRLPTPPQMHNAGNYVVSLGDVCRWLAEQAEALGVEIYPGFAAAELLVEEGQVVGVATGDMGVGRDGSPGANHQPGMELRAAYTLFGEGCRGSLSKQVMARFGLRDGVDPQTYALGIKELWEVPSANHRPGLIEHTVGWPLDSGTYGGSWLYHFGDNLVSYGFVVGLDYANPWLSPFDEMQRLKAHPAVAKHLVGGRRIGYGARALSEGGAQSVPKLTFPGGALIGDSAGFLNVAKIKGTHTAMKSGMLAAEALADALEHGRPAEPESYTRRVHESWLWAELLEVRNIRPSFARFGLWGALAYSAIDTYVLRGRAPPPRRPRDAAAGGALGADRLPEAGRGADLRPAVLGVPQQHQPRGGPADAPAAARPGEVAAGELGAIRQPGEPLLPGRGVRGGGRRGRRAAAAHRGAELRALQDLRHQGPHAEHRLGSAGGRRRTGIPGRDVAGRKARLRLCLKLRQRLAFGIHYLSKAGPGAARPWRVWAEPSLACWPPWPCNAAQHCSP